MPSFDEAMDLVKEDIAGVPVWAIVGGGAVGLFVLTKLLGKSGGQAGDVPQPGTPEQPGGITRDEYSELSGPQFTGLTSNLEGRFSNLDTAMAAQATTAQQQFQDYTQGLAKASAATQTGFNSVYSQLATGQKQTADAISAQSTRQSADIKRIEGKIDALREAEAKRDARQADTFAKILDMLRKLPGGGATTTAPTKSPPATTRGTGGGGGYTVVDPYRALMRGPFDPRRQQPAA